MKPNENIFSKTPMSKVEKNEQKEDNCIFRKQEKKEENPIKIPNNLFRSQLEDLKIDNNKNKQDNKNENNIFNDNNLNVNNMQSKTQILPKKRKNDFLKTSINLNMMENNYNPSFNSKNSNISNNEINNDDNNAINFVSNNNNIFNKDNSNRIINENNNINNNNNINFDNNNNKYEQFPNNNSKNNLKIIDNNGNIDNNIINKDNNNNNNNIDINNNIINNMKNKDSNKNDLNGNISNKNLRMSQKNYSSQEKRKEDDKGILQKENRIKHNCEEINKAHERKARIKLNKEEIEKKKLEDELSRAQVKDHLKCYICYNNINKPRMCRNCKKLACEQCIKNWLKAKKQCAFCRTKIKFDDTIYIPIVEELSNYFINEVEKPLKNESYNDNSLINSQSEEIINSNNNNQKNEDICEEHKCKYEYFCVQCYKKCCSKCLIFIDKASKIHEKHLIIPLKHLEKQEIKEAINEYKKLEISKNNVDDLIKLCNLKIKEMEIEKNRNIDDLDLIKRYINEVFDKELKKLKNKYNSLKLKDDEIGRALETTPMALNNIVKSKDYGQGEKIYEHIKKLNVNIDKNPDINVKLQNNIIENFTTEQLEFTLPQGGKYVENLEVFKKKLDNFIKDNECIISLKYRENNIYFDININNKNNKNNNNKNKNAQDKVNYYGFIIIQNKKYDCEFVVTEDKENYNNHNLTVQFNSNHFISFKDENNKIRFKLYVMKHETKSKNN